MSSGQLITDYLSSGSGAPSGAPSVGVSGQYGLYENTANGDIYAWNLSGTPGWSKIWDHSGGTGFANPMTTAGDLIIGGSSGAATRLAIGTTNYVLTVVSGAPAWAAAGGSSSGLLVAAYYNPTGGVVSKTATTTLTAMDTTHLRATFTAPASGNVVVKYSPGRMQCKNSTGHVGVLEGSTNLGTSEANNAMNGQNFTPNLSLYLSGIAAGSHSYDLAIVDQNLVVATIYGYGYSTSNFADGTSPAFIEVWSAP